MRLRWDDVAVTLILTFVVLAAWWQRPGLVAILCAVLAGFYWKETV